jgi:hypothetical protein
MSGWQPTKGKAAAIGGVQHRPDDEPAQKTRAVKKHPTHPREDSEKPMAGLAGLRV